MGKKPKIIAGILAISLLVGGIVSAKNSTVEEEYLYKETPVSYATLRQAVMESGSLESVAEETRYQLDLSLGQEEDEEEEEDAKYLAIENIYVSVGEKVAEKTPILSFSQKSIDGVRRKIEAYLTEVEVAYLEAEAAYEKAKSSALQGKTEATVKAKTAQQSQQNQINQWNKEVELLNARIVSNQKWMIQNQADIEEIFQSRDYKEKLEAYQAAKVSFELVNQDNPIDYAQRQSLYLSAKSGFDALESKVEEYRDKIKQMQEEIVTYQEEIVTLQEDFGENSLLEQQESQSKLLNGDLAEITYRTELESAEVLFLDAQKQREAAQKIQSEFEEFIGDGTLYAPCTGRVKQISCEVGDRLKKVQGLVSYMTQDDFEVETAVSEEDISKVKVGDQVVVEVSAYPEDTYEGEVLEIKAPDGESKVSTVSYAVRVSVKAQENSLYDGMSANVSYLISEKKDVVYVAKKAIVEQDEKTYVYKKQQDGEMKLEEVTCGFSDGVSVEVSKGLQEGDVVYMKVKVGEGE